MPTYDFKTPIDLNSLPASVLLAMEKDPAAAMPGAPPNFGRDVVPHYFTTTGYIGSAARAYPIEDEATRNSVENAERMRTECAIMECLESRQRATALLGYHIVPEDERSSRQQDLCRTLTRIISRIPRFVEYRRCLLEALWYGKYAVVNRFSREKVGGHYRTLLSDWAPRHGDKLLFRYADNTQRFKEGQLGIRVHANFAAQMETRFPGPYSQWRKRIEPTQYGLCYWFNDYERETMVVHKHMIEDGPWQDPRMMGRVMGVGIRDRIYWTWYAMQALLQDLLTYSNRAALGVRLWRYPSGNDEWKQKVEESARNAISNGVADILFPVEPNEYASLYGVEQIEPGTAGAQLLAELIERFFLKKIKKYILGQLLTSEAEATGLGSGVAQAHLATFSDIVQYDAANLQETLTEQLVRKIQKENAPKSMGVYVRMVLDTDTPDTEKRLAAIQAAYQMDVPIKIEDIYQLTGLTKPQIGDATVSVSLQQEKQQRQQNQMMMEQQAMMAASQGAEGEGMEGAPEEMPPEEDQPVQATMDVSPENVEETQGPVVPVDGELEEKASLEQPAQGSPWNGFWESLFDTIQGKTTEAPPEDEEPERYDDLDEQTGVFQEAIDDYIHHERSVEDFKEDLAAALDEQWQLSEDLESAFNRQNLTTRLNDAIDFETLTAAIDREFDAAYLRDSLTALLAQRMKPRSDARQQLLDALSKQFGYAGVERYAQAWTPYKGPRGGKGWRRAGTSEVRYQEKSPDHDPKPETELRHHRWKKNGNGTTPRAPKLEREDPYVGFDLDGTLARDEGWKGPEHIGDPIPRMIAKVKWFLHKGIQVRIITARLGLPGKEADISHRAIKQWCKKHIGQLLKVQAHKTPGLVKLYDDKAEGVEKNTGKTDDGQNSDKYTCTAAEIDEAIQSWSPPTEGQIEAGNYLKPRIRLHGMEIAIENPKGTRRRPEWPELCCHYGYISRIGNQSTAEARDGDKVDVFVGHNPSSEIVFVIDQETLAGTFDEHKVIIATTNEGDARKLYLSNYPSGWRCGPITSMTIPQFKAWLDCGDLTKRVAKQVSKYIAQYESDPERYARKKKFNPLQKTFDFDAPKPAAPAAGQSEPGSPWVRMKGDRGATYWYNKVTNPQNDPGGRKYQEEKPGDDDTGDSPSGSHNERMREFKRGTVSDRQVFAEIDYWTEPPLADKDHPMHKVDKALESDPVFKQLLDAEISAAERTDADDPGTLPEGRIVDAYRLRKARSQGIEVPFEVLKSYRKELIDLPPQHDPASVPSPGRAAAMKKRLERDAAEEQAETSPRKANESELRKLLTIHQERGGDGLRAAIKDMPDDAISRLLDASRNMGIEGGSVVESSPDRGAIQRWVGAELLGEQRRRQTEKPTADTEASHMPSTKQEFTEAEFNRLRAKYPKASEQSLRNQAEANAEKNWKPQAAGSSDFEVGESVTVGGKDYSFRGTMERDGKTLAVVASGDSGQMSVPIEDVERKVSTADTEAKEPWQMTPKEYAGDRTGATEVSVSLAAHPGHVKRALAEGKPVPDTVLQAYRNNVWAANELEKRNSTNPQEPTDAQPSTSQENPTDQGQDSGQDQNQGAQGQSAEAQGESEGREGRVVPKSRPKPPSPEQQFIGKLSASSRKAYSKSKQATGFEPWMLKEGDYFSSIDPSGSRFEVGYHDQRERKQIIEAALVHFVDQIPNEVLQEVADDMPAAANELMSRNASGHSVPLPQQNTEHAQLLEQAAPYTEFGENYSRHIAEAVNDLKLAMSRKDGAKFIPHLTETLKMRLEAEQPKQTFQSSLPPIGSLNYDGIRSLGASASIPTKQEDWGTSRSSGKRVGGGQVRGAMGDPPKGIRSYRDYKNASGVSDEAYDELKLLSTNDERDIVVGALQKGYSFDDAMRILYRFHDNDTEQPDRHTLTPEVAAKHLYSLAHDMFASYYGGT